MVGLPVRFLSSGEVINVDREQVIHDLAMACLKVKRFPPDGAVMVEETVAEYERIVAIIRKKLSAQE